MIQEVSSMCCELCFYICVQQDGGNSCQEVPPVNIYKHTMSKEKQTIWVLPHIAYGDYSQFLPSSRWLTLPCQTKDRVRSRIRKISLKILQSLIKGKTPVVH